MTSGVSGNARRCPKLTKHGGHRSAASLPPAKKSLRFVLAELLEARVVSQRVPHRIESKKGGGDIEAAGFLGEKLAESGNRLVVSAKRGQDLGLNEKDARAWSLVTTPSLARRFNALRRTR